MCAYFVFVGKRRTIMPKSIIEPLKLNLQYFAEEDPPSDPPVDPPNDPPTDPIKVELTEEELNKKIEAESDRKLQKALEKQKKEMRAELEKELKEQKAEAERLAKLSEKERNEIEWKKKEDALDKREQELAKKELKAQAITELHEKKLPSSFADFLLSDDGKKTFENIGNFKTAFDEAIEGAVNERLKGDPPKVGNTGGGEQNPFSKDNFNLTEQGKLVRNDPDKAKQLITQAGLPPANYGL